MLRKPVLRLDRRDPETSSGWQCCDCEYVTSWTCFSIPAGFLKTSNRVMLVSALRFWEPLGARWETLSAVKRRPGSFMKSSCILRCAESKKVHSVLCCVVLPLIFSFVVIVSKVQISKQVRDDMREAIEKSWREWQRWLFRKRHIASFWTWFGISMLSFWISVTNLLHRPLEKGLLSSSYNLQPFLSENGQPFNGGPALARREPHLFVHWTMGVFYATGQRKPDELRDSSPVLREPGGDIPLGHSPDKDLSESVTFRHSWKTPP